MSPMMRPSSYEDYLRAQQGDVSCCRMESSLAVYLARHTMHRQNSPPPLFEIHVGFEKNSSRAAELLTDLGTWRTETVSEVFVGHAADGCVNAHDVPGTLALLCTQHLSDQERALQLVEELGQRLYHYSDVRIELEQVLHTNLFGARSAMGQPTEWRPSDSSIVGATLIRDTPPYENHFCIGRRDGRPFSHSTRELLACVEDIGMGIHQAVRFGLKERVILTTFHPDFDEIRRYTPEITASICDFVSSFDDSLIVKVVTERILLCAQPAVPSLATK